MEKFEELLELMTHYGYKYSFEYDEKRVRGNYILNFDKIIWFKEGERLCYRINHSIIQSLPIVKLEEWLLQIENFDNEKDTFYSINKIKKIEEED